jgi:hypothetical protein
MSQLDTDKMVIALTDSGVSLNLNPLWDNEETYNYIINLFNITFLPVTGLNYKQEQEIAKIVYSLRKSRGQKWLKPYK